MDRKLLIVTFVIRTDYPVYLSVPSSRAERRSPSISCNDLPAIPCKSPYIPTVAPITRIICPSRLAHRFMLTLRSFLFHFGEPPPFFREPVFLPAAAGFVRNGHFDQTRLQRRLQILLTEMHSVF